MHCIVLIYNFLYNLKKNDHLTKLSFSLPCLISYANVYTVWQLRSIELKFNAKYQQQWRWITRKVQTISAILVQCTYIKYGMRCLTVQRRSEHWICMCKVQGCTHGSVLFWPGRHSDRRIEHTIDTCFVRLFEDCTVPNWFFRAG